MVAASNGKKESGKERNSNRYWKASSNWMCRDVFLLILRPAVLSSMDRAPFFSELEESSSLCYPEVA